MQSLGLLNVNKDARGVFAELLTDVQLKSVLGHVGQVSYLEVEPGQVRGGHRHVRKREIFVLLFGDCQLRVIGQDEVSDERPMQLYSPTLIEPGEAHWLIGGPVRSGLLVICSERFNRVDPDTFPVEG